jgi:hypothetical protein
MAIEVDPNSIDEKNDFLNRQDMAIGSIDMSISPELFHQVYEESQGLTPNGPYWRLYLGTKNIVNISCRRSNR